MVTFSFIQYGENLGTRPLGQRVRESLLPMIEQNDLVVLDFTGVNVVSNSFADECIAKLLLQMMLTALVAPVLFGGSSVGGFCFRIGLIFQSIKL